MSSSLYRIRNGAILLIAVFVVATCGFRYWGGHDWIGAIWMVVITISTVGYGEQSSLGPVSEESSEASQGGSNGASSSSCSVVPPRTGGPRVRFATPG